MATFVLVPGGFHGGWCYAKVARLLRAGGHDVHTPTLTGLGDRSHLLDASVDLDTHILDIFNLLLWEDLDDVVMAGHSYGGMVITAVADRLPNRVRCLVYIDAITPHDGEAVIDRTHPHVDKALLRSLAANPGPAVAPYPAATWVRGDGAAWVDAKTTAMPLAALCQPVRLTGAHAAVSHRVYLYAAGGAEDARYRAFAEQPGAVVRGIEDTGHDIMVDQPEALAVALSETCARDAAAP